MHRCSTGAASAQGTVLPAYREGGRVGDAAAGAGSAIVGRRVGTGIGVHTWTGDVGGTGLVAVGAAAGCRPLSTVNCQR